MKLSEELLKLIRDAVFCLAVEILIVDPAIERLAELRSHKESLDHAV